MTRRPRPVPPCAWELPDPARAPAGQDLLGVGADLAPGTLVEAYSRGLFPMEVDDDATLGWWSPDPRGVLPLDGLRVSRSLRRSLRRYSVTVDEAFDAVMDGCAEGRPDAWITAQFRAAYGELHRLGWAHSFEVWDNSGDLVGGLYGVEIGGMFAGESMFHRARDASKVALVHAVDALGGSQGAAEGRILDVQWRTSHLASLGVIDIPRGEYLARLQRARTLAPRLIAISRATPDQAEGR